MTATLPDLAEELGKFGARNPDSERLMGMIVALAGEVFVQKAQIERLTRALAAAGVVDDAALAKAAADEGLARWLAAEEGAFARAFTAPFLEPDLTKNVTPWMRKE